MKIALLGAESTGKSQLANELAAHLSANGQPALAVAEYLREWCEREGRTPQPHEQAHIAHTQQARIEAATTQAHWVIADTTPLMTAVYSEFIFADTSLHTSALAYQRSFDLTLITGLDMPWEADGIQRDGEHVRAPVDTLLRKLLLNASIGFEVIYGLGEHRLHHAMRAIDANHSIAPCADSITASARKPPITTPSETVKPWGWSCDKCSDPDCEHRLFTRLF